MIQVDGARPTPRQADHARVYESSLSPETVTPNPAVSSPVLPVTISPRATVNLATRARAAAQDCGKRAPPKEENPFQAGFALLRTSQRIFACGTRG